MLHTSTVFHYIAKYGSKIAAFPFRRYFTATRLNECLIFDVTASGDPINYQLSTFEGFCWLDTYNLSPFELSIDRMTVEVVLDGGSKFVCTLTTPRVLKPCTHNRIHVKGMSPMSPQLFEAAKKLQRAWVNIDAYVNCSIRPFEVHKQINDLKSTRLL